MIINWCRTQIVPNASVCSKFTSPCVSPLILLLSQQQLTFSKMFYVPTYQCILKSNEGNTYFRKWNHMRGEGQRKKIPKPSLLKNLHCSWDTTSSISCFWCFIFKTPHWENLLHCVFLGFPTWSKTHVLSKML